MGNEVSATTPPTNADPTQHHHNNNRELLHPKIDAVPTKLTWPHGGNVAYICGTFTHWQKMPMHLAQHSASNHKHAQQTWQKVVDLTPGTHQYKFIIDGQWRHDHTAPTVLDNLGNVNNCITISHEHVDNSILINDDNNNNSKHLADPANRTSPSPRSSSFSQSKTERMPAHKQRMSSDPYHLATASGNASSSYGNYIPPREELLVQHSASLLLPPQLRLLLPHQHADEITAPLSVQLHHLFCDLDSEMEVFAMAHRYRDRTITHILYKPARKPRRLGYALQLEEVDPMTATTLQRRTRTSRASEERVLQSVRLSGTNRLRDGNGHEYIAYVVESVMCVHGMQTVLRVERRYKHFHVLHQLLHQQFGPLVPQAFPAKRAFGNLQPSFVEERRVALERYLQQCVALPEIVTSSIFCNFVDADESSTGFSIFDGSAAELAAGEPRESLLGGSLLKYGRRVAAWKRRYFIVCDGVLKYYYTQVMSDLFQPLGEVQLKEPNEPQGDRMTDTTAIVTELAKALVTLEFMPSCGVQDRYGFALHTDKRSWRLAAISSEERMTWIRALCQAGAQLSSSSGVDSVVLTPKRCSKTGQVVFSSGDSSQQQQHSELPVASAPEATKAGLLWKRGSKVHVSNRADAEDKPRDWVARHFVLLAARGELVWTRAENDSWDAVSGIVPLNCYTGVVAAPSSSEELFGFQLTHLSGDVSRSFLLATQSAEAMSAWSSALAQAIASAPVASSGTDAMFDGYPARDSMDVDG